MGSRPGLAAVLLVAALFAATSTRASEASPRRSADAFDDALRKALVEGMGVTPEEGAKATAALEDQLPAGDALRRRRLDAMACAARNPDSSAGLARADALVRRESQPDGDPFALAMAHSCRAGYLPQTGPYTPLLAAYDAALDAAERSADPRLIGSLLVARSGVHSLAGDFAKALVDALDAQKAFESDGDPLLVASNLQGVGIAYRRMGEWDRAESLLKESLQHPEIAKRWSFRITSLLQLGYLYDETGRAAEARAMFRDAIDVCTQARSLVDCGYARLGLAGVDAANGNADRALAVLQRAEADFAAGKDPGDPTMVALVRGQALGAKGEPEAAIVELDRAIATWRDAGNDRYLALALPVRAAVLERMGRHEAAIADLRAYIDVHARDDARRAAQRTDLMREQFDAARREIENAELRAKQQLREREIEVLRETRRWQWIALGLGVVLVGLLVVLALRQIAKARRMQVLAMTDALTGLANRRRTEYRGRLAVREARISGTPLAVLAIDIDHFKRVNDTHGHAIGDAVLARVGRECHRTLRQHDLIGRIGGEEFAGLLPETTLEAAAQVAERIRRGVETLDLDDVVPGLRVTISVGVASLARGDEDFPGLLDRADQALYRAKGAGRNRVEVAASP